MYNWNIQLKNQYLTLHSFVVYQHILNISHYSGGKIQ
jgi:hypothetical protein